MVEMDKSSRPWSGETGFLDRAMLERHLKGLAEPTRGMNIWRGMLKRIFRKPTTLRVLFAIVDLGVLLLIGAAVAVRITKQRTALVAQDNEPVDEDIRSS